MLISTSYIFAGCDHEEDDLIPEPTETSTVLTGYIKTPEGTPLANIPVSVDFKVTGLFGTSVIHKAKGTTDKTGFYKIFFEADEEDDVGIHSGYTFSVDFSVLSADKYILAEEVYYGFTAFADDWSGSTIKSNFIVPRKKLVKVIVKNNGESVENGRYAVKNMFPYFVGEVLSNDLNLWYDYDKWHIFESVDIPQSGSISVALPCAIGVENTIKVVYLGDETIQYGIGLPASDTREITVTDTFNDEIEFDYFTPNLNIR